MSKRKNWSNEAKRTFAEALYRARREGTGNWRECSRKAMQALPEADRRPRHITSPNQLSWLPPMLEEIARQGLPPRETPPRVEQAPASSDLQELCVAALADALQPLILETLQSESFQQALRQRIKIPSETVQTVVEKVVEGVVTPQPAKPTVLIVGLIRQQSQEVEKAFQDRLNLRFLPAEASSTRIQLNSKSADAVVIMTKFISHRVQTALRQHQGLTWCHGSVSSLKTLLEDLSSEGQTSH